MEQAYTGFAEVYDTFMDNVPYEEWSKYLIGLLKQYGVEDGIVVDLGCGTGSMTELLSEAGYDMIGVDNAPDMLQIAMEKQTKTKGAGTQTTDILYLLQDMRELDLYGTAKAMVSVCDSVNYVTEPEDLIQTFEKVRTFLDPEGIFIFDFNTVHKYRDVIGDTTISESREDASFIWENYYDEESQINEYDLTLFIQEKEIGEDLYRKYEETHYQRGYELSEMKECLEKAGLHCVASYDAFTTDSVSEYSERVYCIAKKQQVL